MPLARQRDCRHADARHEQRRNHGELPTDELKQFLGMDAEDSESAAEEWLAERPVPYPTYFETGDAIAAALKLPGRPDTAFYNRKGKLVYLKIGPYTRQSDLEADIKKYALEQR